MINLNDYEEITREEFDEMDEAGIRLTNNYNHTEFYFKKKSKDVFEDDSYLIKIHGNGIKITVKEDFKLSNSFSFDFDISLPLLEQAIEEAKNERAI